MCLHLQGVKNFREKGFGRNFVRPQTKVGGLHEQNETRTVQNGLAGLSSAYGGRFDGWLACQF